MTTTDLATVNVQAQMKELEVKREWCQMMAGGDMLPRQYREKPANLLYAVEYADQLGIPRINALTSIHVIEGKPSASADLIAALVRKAGHRLRVSTQGHGRQTVVTASVWRADDPDFEFRVIWNWQRAEDAGLTGKNNWKNYPEAMLKARAITEVAREAANDALFGIIYTPEELGAVVGEDGEPTQQRPQPHNRVAAQATRQHPAAAQQQETAPATHRMIAEIESDIDAAGDDVSKIRKLWKEAKAAGYEELVSRLNAKFAKAPETPPSAPVGDQQAESGTNPQGASAEPLEGDQEDSMGDAVGLALDTLDAEIVE